MKMIINIIGLSFILGNLSVSPVMAQSRGDYVSREEYEKLKRDFERMKAMVQMMEKRLEQRVTPEKADEDLDKVKGELKKVQKQAKEAKRQAKAVLPGVRKFLLTGYGFAGFRSSQRTDSSFSAGFNPIFLWRISDRIFFEGEAEFELEDSETNISLEFAQISYLLNDYMTIGVGKFLNPTNYFMERLHPAWINKLPDLPLSIDGDNRIQSKGLLGAQLRGGIPLRMIGLSRSRIGYAFYVANGPEMQEDGSLAFNNYTGSNSGKSVGGRIGLVPLPGLEVGYGFEIGRSQDPFLSRNRDITTHIVDFNYSRVSPVVLGQLHIHGQWAWRDIENSTDLAFDNEVKGGYGLVAYRPSLSGLRWLMNLEGVFRFDRMNQPSGSAFYDENRYTVGMNYYFNPSTLFKFAYQFDDRVKRKDDNALMFQAAIGF